MPADVIILSHGARDQRWREPFEALREKLQAALPGRRVALAFMEFAEPTLAAAADELVSGSSSHVLVVPVFLSGGGHVGRDIPVLVDEVKRRHPQLRVSVAGATGEEPEVAAAMVAAIARVARQEDPN